MGHGGRWILDSLKTGAVHINYYTDADLTIGSLINVWGRRFLLFDCDEYTKDHYQSKFGVNNFQPIKYKSDLEPAKPREIPPYNGFGSEEDSLCSCLGLIPKPPKRDFIKFMEKDRFVYIYLKKYIYFKNLKHMQSYWRTLSLIWYIFVLYCTFLQSEIWIQSAT